MLWKEIQDRVVRVTKKLREAVECGSAFGGCIWKGELFANLNGGHFASLKEIIPPKQDGMEA